MDKISANVPELLAKLRENRAKHVTDFEESKGGYRTKLRSLLNRAQDELDDGQAPNLVKIRHLDRPKCRTKEYDQAIGMLELCVNEVIKIDVEDYERFVCDNWSWSRGFRDLHTHYSRGG